MKINKKNILLFIIIVVVFLVVSQTSYILFSKYKRRIKNEQEKIIEYKKEQENIVNKKNNEVVLDKTDYSLINTCNDKQCLYEKFKTCKSSQFVIDEKVQYKAYFLISGIIENNCVILVEKDMKNGTLCNIPENIERTEKLFNELLENNFNSVKDYCKNISAGK